jgi:hypothetical protein
VTVFLSLTDMTRVGMHVPDDQSLILQKRIRANSFSRFRLYDLTSRSAAEGSQEERSCSRLLRRMNIEA